MSRRGAPSLYTPELAARICARLSSGLSLRRVCRAKDMPAAWTVLRWVAEREEFRGQYMRAMEARGCRYGEQVVEVVEKTIGRELPPDVARVAIDGLKWAAGRMAPKVYGDRLALTGGDGGDIGIRVNDARATVDGKLARLAAEHGPTGVPREPE